jgi:hypothetical protein
MSDLANITNSPNKNRIGKEETMAELKAKGVCDFCGEACNADMRGAKAYDCDDFPMPMTGAMSYGAWGACPACAELIDSEQWHALEDRTTVTANASDSWRN